ncbi:hypothetical protein [Gordonia sp. (in: high G+C Gram-positive bacteria)]|uniref:hypothetical protein n=1 Tax=Gordonia sp. (in: high G+C Gram-positive bacteria) TaxID=84139 RepID=UPI003527824E
MEADDEAWVVETERYRIRFSSDYEMVTDPSGAERHMPRWLVCEFFGYDEPNSWARVELRDQVPRLVELGWRAGAESREIKPTDLRGHDLNAIVEDLYATFVISVIDKDKDTKLVLHHGGVEEIDPGVRRFLEDRRSPRPRITGALLKDVAKVYRANIKHAPTEAVAKTFGVKHRTATNYVKQARDRGLLPPTKQGRAKA